MVSPKIVHVQVVLKTLPFGYYTQSQKKRTVESCASFAEECRCMNFVVYFILPMWLVTMCKKPHSKISQGSLAILRSLSTSKVTKIHSLRKLESCISFSWECTLAKLGSHIILTMLLKITCKRPHRDAGRNYMWGTQIAPCPLKNWVQELSNGIWQPYMGMSYTVGKLFKSAFQWSAPLSICSRRPCPIPKFSTVFPQF